MELLHLQDATKKVCTGDTWTQVSSHTPAFVCVTEGPWKERLQHAAIMTVQCITTAQLSQLSYERQRKVSDESIIKLNTTFSLWLIIYLM